MNLPAQTLDASRPTLTASVLPLSLKLWIRQEIVSGQPWAEIVAEMVGKGWAAEFARQAANEVALHAFQDEYFRADSVMQAPAQVAPERPAQQVVQQSLQATAQASLCLDWNSPLQPQEQRVRDYVSKSPSSWREGRVLETLGLEWAQWVTTNLSRGVLLGRMRQDMAANGWNPAVIEQALLEGAMRLWGLASAAQGVRESNQASNDATIAQLATQRHSPMPWIDFDQRSWVDCEGHRIQILGAVKHPYVVILGNILSPTECDELVELSRPTLKPSLVISNQDGSSVSDKARTSEGTFHRRNSHELITRLDRRVAALLHWPEDQTEDVQILRYAVGAEYKPHNDYFNPEAEGSKIHLGRGGQRLGTLIIYLNDPDAGGSTVFPDAGIDVKPHKGSGVFFAYDQAHAQSKTLHGGAPVLAGEKWIATKWVRQLKFA